MRTANDIVKRAVIALLNREKISALAAIDGSLEQLPELCRESEPTAPRVADHSAN